MVLEVERAASAAAGVAGALAPVDLLNDLDGLAGLLASELALAAGAAGESRADHLLDGFLLACGMNQVAEDHLHEVPAATAAAAAVLGRRGPARAAALACEAGRGLRDLGLAGRPGALRWQRGLARLVDLLAAAAAAGEPGAAGAQVDEIREAAALVLDGLARLPRRLRGTVLRLPDCFRAFDQQPGDCELLAGDFAARWDRRDVPLLAVGVRTSGSYLAPLLAAFLRRLGFVRVAAMTCRPGQPWLPGERSRLSELRRAGGIALLVDDPPVTGRKLASSATDLQAAGLAPDSIVLALPLFGEAGAVPEPLRAWPRVVLPSAAWSVNRRLEPGAVRETLRLLLRGRDVSVRGDLPVRVVDVGDVSPVPLEPIRDVKARPLVRSHLRRRYLVELIDPAGRRFRHDLYARGTGTGYLGRHSLAIGRRLEGRIPDLYGWQGGVLFRAGLPEAGRLTVEAPPGPAAAGIAGYVAARRRSLAVPADRSLAMRGRSPAWQFAADLVSSGLGRARPLAAPALYRAARRVLSSPQPSVVDGSTALPHWFVPDGGEPAAGLLKVDYDERAFSVWDTWSYDPALDLAIAGADHDFRSRDGSDLAERLRDEYRRLTGETISDERWLLYRYLHLAHNQMHFRRLLRQGPGQLQRHAGTPPPDPGVREAGFREAVLDDLEAGDRALSRAVSGYLAVLHLADVAPAGDGPLCALPLEGLLESAWLRGGALTVAGARTLRALRRHGFRPLLLTARSVPEGAFRCRAYGAAAAVVEHGCASMAADGEERCLLSPGDADALDAFREGLGAGLRATSGYCYAVRAYEVAADGAPRSPRLPGPAPGLRAVAGAGQVDVVPAGTDLAWGLARHTAASGGPEPVRAGSAAEVAALLGHRPGGCHLCRGPELDARAELLVTLLEAHDRGALARAGLALRLWGVARRLEAGERG